MEQREANSTIIDSNAFMKSLASDGQSGRIKKEAVLRRPLYECSGVNQLETQIHLAIREVIMLVFRTAQSRKMLAAISLMSAVEGIYVP